MKTLAALIALSAASFAFGQTADQTKPTKKTAPKKVGAKQAEAKKTEVKKPQPPLAQPLTIPPDAVQNENGTYSYTDKAGKKWVYAKSPFGVSRTEDTSVAGAAPAVPEPVEQAVKATDKGETVVFRRQTPFGATTWEKKKSDLNEEERHILESQQPKPE